MQAGKAMENTWECPHNKNCLTPAQKGWQGGPDKFKLEGMFGQSPGRELPEQA